MADRIVVVFSQLHFTCPLFLGMADNQIGEGDIMYSTGTEFHKALSEAQNRGSLNTAAALAQNAKELIESWTPLKVEMITVKGKDKLITLGARAEVSRCG